MHASRLRLRKLPEKREKAANDAPAAPTSRHSPPRRDRNRREVLILILVVAPLAAYVVGVLRFNWAFNELSGLFFIAALLIGVIGRLGPSGGTAAYLEGMETMLAAAMLVGIARAISVVLTDGRVIDTIVQGLAAPLYGKAPAWAGVLMVPMHALIHFRCRA